MKPVSWPARTHEGLCSGGAFLHSPFLLAVRPYWGWPFVQTGWGKQHHFGRIKDFASLLVLIFGASFFSLGAVIAKRWRKPACA